MHALEERRVWVGSKGNALGRMHGGRQVTFHSGKGCTGNRAEGRSGDLVRDRTKRDAKTIDEKKSKAIGWECGGKKGAQGEKSKGTPTRGGEVGADRQTEGVQRRSEVAGKSGAGKGSKVRREKRGDWALLGNAESRKDLEERGARWGIGKR